jgi:hypothetical protein
LWTEKAGKYIRIYAEKRGEEAIYTKKDHGELIAKDAGSAP